MPCRRVRSGAGPRRLVDIDPRPLRVAPPSRMTLGGDGTNISGKFSIATAATALLRGRRRSAPRGSGPLRSGRRGHRLRVGAAGLMRAVGILAAVSSPRPGSTADHAGNMVADAVREVEASGAAAHVHVSVTTEPPTAPVAVEAAPLRAPTLREYLPAAAARGPFRGRRQAPGYPAPQNTVGQTPGQVAMFLPRGVPTAPLPSRAGRDPTLSMCRMWNLAGAAEGLASLQLAACEAMRSAAVLSSRGGLYRPHIHPPAAAQHLLPLGHSHTSRRLLDRPPSLLGGWLVACRGLLQYFRLVEGCVDLIATHQQQHNISYRWVIRTRVDGYWTAPPPLLPSLHPSAYTIPFGFDWGGLNDRLGIGSWDASKVALRRLSALQDLFSAGYRALTSEKAFRAQMDAAGVAVARKHFHFCVVTRRRSRGGDGCAAMMFSTATYGPLNGAKCRPCSSPCAVDDQAAAIINTVRAAGGMYRHPLPPGMQLCDAKQAWEGAWERQFDRDVERQRGGKTLSWQRRNIGRVAASLAHCTEQFNKLKAVSVTWDSPPPVAVCIRAQLGEVELMGSKTGEFNTFTSLLTSKSTFISVTNSKASQSWERHLFRRYGKGECSLVS
ncbi:unnamed protein product [Closterium sp. NIES-64]|nr:unnamed protein product [Closterium sp. NIES-64]